MATGDERHSIEDLAEEFLKLQREGKQVSVEDYETRYPELADEIREVFPALVAMEVAKPKSILAPQLASFDAVAKGKITRLGDFRIIRKIAHGGMGIVYEAEEISLDRKVAIKVLSTHLITDEKALERFQREAKTIARLHHTNIVSVFGAGVENDLYFFVMEFIDGKSLDRLFKSGEYQERFAEDWNWTAEVVKRIALALRHAHQKNILHRDIKPGNILIDSDLKPWVTDFGLAKLDEHDDLTRPGDAVGTLRYMAPEQMKGQADARTDVFGLGLVMYEMLVGEKVYSDAESHQLLERIKSRELATPRKCNPNIPLDLERVVLKAIELDPKDRYQQAVDFAEDLDRWQHDLPVNARPLSTFETCRRWARRNPLIAGLATGVVGLVAVLIISFALIAFAWLGEKSAKLDAEIAQRAAEESRRDAENSVGKAIEVLDRLSADVGIFNRIGDPNPENQSFLFSPLGGIPVSRNMEEQLDVIREFYQSIGEWSDKRREIRIRRMRASIRTSEILIQLQKYILAKEILNKIVDELRLEAKDSEFVQLRLYANYLLGYAHLLERNFGQAEQVFNAQLGKLDSLSWEADAAAAEKGKIYLGLGILAHHSGNIRGWYESLDHAIAEFEELVDWQKPETNPVPALYLARSYLNLPPRYPGNGYQEFHEECSRRAVCILYRLNQFQAEKTDNNNDPKALVFFVDFCHALSELSRNIKVLDVEEPIEVKKLLRETIATCQGIVRNNRDVPAYRFALAKCQINLAFRDENDFEALAKQAVDNLAWLKESFPNDPAMLTELGVIRVAIGNYHLSSRDYSKAKSFLQLAIQDLEDSLHLSARYPKTHVYLSDAHENLALVFDALNDKKNASYHRRRKAMVEKEFPAPRIRPLDGKKKLDGKGSAKLPKK